MNNSRQQLNGGPRKRPLLLTAAALLGIAAGPVLLSTPALAQSGPEFHACYVPGSGTVYRIKEPGLRQECSSPNHVAFSWTAEGEQGPGGVPGYEIVVSATDPMSSTSFWGGRAAECPEGKRALGGGASVLTPDGFISGDVDLDRMMSWPEPDGTKWWGHVGITNPQARTFVFNVYAVCALVEGGV